MFNITHLKLNNNLYEVSNKVRILSLISIYYAKSGHPGGCLSCADLLTYIFLRIKNIPNNNVHHPFILSKGHSCPALYSIASYINLIPESEIFQLRKLDSRVQGHPSVDSLPWVEASTGSLGQGLSVGLGMALGYKHSKNFNSMVYVIIGDGELQEGEVWEALMCAANFKLNNLCVILDYNKMQSDDLNENIMIIEPLRSKFEAFGWNVLEIDGHDFNQIDSAFDLVNNEKIKPSIIIANTVKGKGVSFMEHIPSWHGSVQIKAEELKKALQELGLNKKEINFYLENDPKSLSLSKS